MTDFTTSALPDVALTPDIRAVLDHIAPSAGDVGSAISMPPYCYTSEDWFEFERRAIFDREWMALGHQGLIPKPGDYFSISLNGEPMLVVRGADREIRVLSAVCRHRGHLLGEASGHADAFTCPFHGWSYDLTGKLLSAPEMNGTLPLEELRKTACLPVLRSEIWNGFIFVNFDGRAAPLGPRLKVLTGEVANHHMADMVSIPTVDLPENPWNWKFMQENAIEPYHTHYLHQGPHDFAPSNLASFFEWDDTDDGAVFHPTGFVEPDSAFNISTKCLMPVIETLSARDRQRVMFASVPPNLFFGAQPDCVFYLLIMPKSAGRIVLRVGILVPYSTTEIPTFELAIKGTIDGISIFNDADTRANTSSHQGLGSRFAQRTRYAPKEKTLAQFNTWLIKRYQSYARELAARNAPETAMAAE
jgi:phenylpropionate dioxygenase-like ring-hydroxylating dioxygenase large terminal subunit